MFDDLKIPCISVIENMSFFTCNKCSTPHYLFGKGKINAIKN